ncbi:MAG: TetR/AcrR family transcriptional regulator [Roseburia sp.]
MKTKKYSMSAPVCIAQAMLAMMEHTPIDEIRIKDLIRKAGVSRMSYYRYFSGKTDVLKFYLDYVLEEYFESIDGKDGSVFQSYEHVLDALQFFYRYREVFLCLQRAGMSGIVLDALNRYTERQNGFVHGDTERAYSLYYYAGAIFNVYMQWISKGAKESPQKLARLITDNIYKK